MRLLNTPIKVNLVLLLIFAILFALLYLVVQLTSVFILLGATLVVVYLLLGPVKFVEDFLREQRWLRRLVSPARIRAFSILFIYVFFFLLINLTLIRIVPLLTVQLREFSTADFPAYLSQVEDSIAEWTRQDAAAGVHENFLTNLLNAALSSGGMPSDDAAQEPEARPPTDPKADEDGSLRRQFRQMVSAYATSLGGYLLNIGTNALAGLIYVLTLLVMVYYLLQDGRVLKDGFVSLMPNRFEAGAAWFLERLHRQFYNFVKGQVMVSILAGVLTYLLLMLLGIKYAFLLSFIFGLASIIPVLGPWFGLLPILIVVPFNAPSYHILNVLFFAGVFYILKICWLWPRLIPEETDIHPVLFLLVFLVCLKLGGFLGIFMAFPLSSVISVVLYAIRPERSPERSERPA